MLIKSFTVGDLVVLDWNHELVQVIDQWDSCTKIKSVKSAAGEDTAGATREVSTGTEVEPYTGQFDGARCACGCGRLLSDRRSGSQYATSACRKRVSRAKV